MLGRVVFLCIALSGMVPLPSASAAQPCPGEINIWTYAPQGAVTTLTPDVRARFSAWQSVGDDTICPGELAQCRITSDRLMLGYLRCGTDGDHIIIDSWTRCGQICYININWDGALEPGLHTLTATVSVVYGHPLRGPVTEVHGSHTWTVYVYPSSCEDVPEPCKILIDPSGDVRSPIG